MDFIPKHKNCKNCGGCCGPVPINNFEYKTIQNYVDINKPKYNKKTDFMTCKFRVDGCCSIYKVRPTLCKLFGVTKGMNCPNGNSYNIDGFKILNKQHKNKIKGLINEVIKTDY